MKRTSVDEFKALLSREAAIKNPAEAASASALADRARMRLEYSRSGVATLVAIARFASLFEGFPERVSLEAGNGYGKGLSAAVDTSGVWRLSGSDAVIRDALSYGLATSRLSAITIYALQAMGIPHSPDVHRRLLDMARWDSGVSLRATLLDLAPTLPSHVLAGLLAHGSELDDFFRPHDRWEGELVDVLVARGIPLDVAPFETLPSPIAVLAEQGDFRFLDAALKAGASPNAPGVAFAAVSNGNSHCLRRLIEAGLDVSSPANEGLLHEAAQKFAEVITEHGGAYAFPVLRSDIESIFELLLDAGVDPHGTDGSGRTALDIIEAARDASRTVLVEENEGLIDSVVAMLEAPRAAPTAA